jgi:thiol-disulfide isomerase/thioredoxin
MKRRTFLAFASAAVGSAALSPAQAATGMVLYSDGLIAQALAEGRTVFVDYAADWCSTCARQERVIAQLMAENPDYARDILFVRVDWDAWGRKPVTTSRNIPRRSTLIVLKGDAELGRIVAGTGTAEIKALMDTALAAAQST